MELCTYDNTSFYKCQLSTDLHVGRTYLIMQLTKLSPLFKKLLKEVGIITLFILTHLPLEEEPKIDQETLLTSIHLFQEMCKPTLGNNF